MKKKRSNSKQKPYWEMTTAELREATKQFDKPIDLEKETRPLTARGRQAFDRFIRERSGRRGSTTTPLALDAKLVRLAEKQASELGISLQDYIEHGIRGMIAFRGR